MTGPTDEELLAQIISGTDTSILLDNPDLFLLRYFPHRITAFKDFHLRLIANATTERRGLILYPATHGKTTIVSTLLPIWAVCRDPNSRTLVLAKNESEGGGIMRVIQAELLENEELINDFGPFFDADDAKNKPWTLERVTVLGCTRRMKEANISVFGAGARTALGYRTDWTICDDVVTDKNSSSPTQRQTLRDWFDLAVETGPEAEESRLTVVGTLFDPNDLYHDLREMINPETGKPIWKVQHEDAIVDEEAKITLWPERWSWGRLMELKAKLGTLNFNKRMRNIAVDASRMAFREEYIKGGYLGRQLYPGCLDRDYRVGDYEATWKRAGGFDPAVGSTRHAKFCAHIVLAAGTCQKHERCYWVVDLERLQLTTPQQGDLIIAKHGEYDLLTSRVEANSYQGGLVQVVERRMEELGLAYRVEPHFTHRANKPDPEIGVTGTSRWFENGAVHIPWGDPHSIGKMKQFVEELVMYPGRTTDTVMAFWFAWLALEQAAPKWDTFNRLDRPGQANAPWRRRGRTIRNPIYT